MVAAVARSTLVAAVGARLAEEKWGLALSLSRSAFSSARCD